MPEPTPTPDEPWPFAKPEVLNVFVMTLPHGDDPDSFIRREGPSAFQTLIDAAMPAGTWKVSRMFDKLPDWLERRES